MNKKIKVSKNQPTLKHLNMACRHIEEMVKAGMTENHAIRLLELFADVYAKLKNGGSATPHSVSQVRLWSVAARRWRRANPNAKPGSNLRVEHGTPRRQFAKLVLELYKANKLNKQRMDRLVKKRWKLAVITHEEDRRLARSSILKTPEERWREAGIHFSKVNARLK